MSGHSNIGPSSAKRWINCPGSVGLCAKLPRQPSSEFAVEGTVAHGLAEELVTGKIDSLELMSRVGTIVKQDGFEIEIGEDMVDGAIEYHDLIKADRDMLARLAKPAPIVGKAEVRVQAKSVDEDLWGTADYILYRKGDVLIVYDYKFGKGVIVDPEENEQAAIYAIAVMDGEAGWAFDKVIIKIHQPRGNHIDGTVREWEAPIGWLRNFRDSLKPAVAATRDPKAIIKTGDWCRWCAAKAVCPAMFKTAEEQAGASFDVVAPAKGSVAPLPEVRLMSVEKLALALSWQDAVESWFVSVKEFVTEKLLAGEVVPGWKLVDGRANRRWINEQDVVAAFEGILGDKLYESKLLSPAKLEKLVGKGKVDHLTEKPEAKKSVARDIDPRSATVSKGEDAFSVLNPVLLGDAAQMHEEMVERGDDLMSELMGAPAEAPKKRDSLWPV